MALVVLSNGAGGEPSTPSPVNNSGITISKETTYITEPLKQDGTVDYVAALDQQARRGVTPENNAAVLFWQAMGPKSIWKENREEYFRRLGMPPLPEQGDYFVNFEEFLALQKGEVLSQDLRIRHQARENVWDLMQSVLKRPWSKQEFPIIAAWLAVNEKPLALLTKASRRPRRYDPVLGDETTLLIAVPMPASFAFSQMEVDDALVARAMLRLHEDKVAEAWEDLLTCHRWARLLSQGPTLIDASSARWPEELACAGDVALLQYARLSKGQIAKMHEDLDRLPPLTSTTFHKLIGLFW